MSESYLKKFAHDFDKKLKSIPVGTYQTTIKNLCIHAEVTTDIIYNYRKGRTYISKPVRDSIELFFNEKIFKG